MSCTNCSAVSKGRLVFGVVGGVCRWGFANKGFDFGNDTFAESGPCSAVSGAEVVNHHRFKGLQQWDVVFANKGFDFICLSVCTPGEPSVGATSQNGTEITRDSIDPRTEINTPLVWNLAILHSPSSFAIQRDSMLIYRFVEMIDEFVKPFQFCSLERKPTKPSSLLTTFVTTRQKKLLASDSERGGEPLFFEQFT